MPELPEVETTRIGLAPHLVDRRIEELRIRQPQLRWRVPQVLRQRLLGQRIEGLDRRAKYLLMRTPAGSALWHLGMSGSLRMMAQDTPIGVHDHIDWLLDSGLLLRYTDPRRFGCLLWQANGSTHELLSKLGPEPLSDDFHVDYLWKISRNRKIPIKQLLMDQQVVVGVGNIYAAEALFMAGIHPQRIAQSISRARYVRLVEAVQRILTHAITRGGTTLRNFLQPDGAPGYFEQELFVYGRADEPCRRCKTLIKSVRLGQRSTFFCSRCQK